MSKTLGKVPEVNDYPGFVANRILMPMINEAIETFYNGVAGVEEIDGNEIGNGSSDGTASVGRFHRIRRLFGNFNVMYDGFKILNTLQIHY